MFKKVIAILLVAVVIAPAYGSKEVDAAPGDNTKVTVCHSTQSSNNQGGGGGPQNNPYNQQSVNKSSITNNPNGHDTHTGPVFNDTNQPMWGDIIPPYDDYAGMNWTAEGQAIWLNGCEYEEDLPVSEGFCSVINVLQVTNFQAQFAVGVTVTEGTTAQGYVFDFGDGTATDSLVENTTNHTYTAAGTYNVVVEVTFMTGEQGEPFTDECATTVTVDPEGTVTATPQVTSTPVGPVSAGVGGATQTNVLTVLGLTGSVFALAFGLIRKWTA